MCSSDLGWRFQVDPDRTGRSDFDLVERTLHQAALEAAILKCKNIQHSGLQGLGSAGGAVFVIGI